MSIRTEKKVFDLPELRDRRRVFSDRPEAGRVLAGMLEAYRGSNAILLAIPAGGVPVAAVIAGVLNLPLDVAVVNKVTPPWNPEVGYGAVAFDGTVILDENILPSFGLSDEEVQECIATAGKKVRRRVELLRGEKPMPSLGERTVILVDDGLATGSTLAGAILALRKAGAKEIVLAVPTGHASSVHKMAGQVEAIYCPNIRGGWQFAVAEAYRFWTDVDENEAAAILAESRGGG